jgi:hypothetical protein
MIFAPSTLAMLGRCMDVKLGGDFHSAMKASHQTLEGIRLSVNGMAYNALPGVPSFLGSVIPSVSTLSIFISSIFSLL